MMTFLAPAEKMRLKRGLKKTGEMGLALLAGGENTGRLDDVLSAVGLPGDLAWLLLSRDGDVVAIDDELASFVVNVSLESAVSRVVLEEVDLQKR